LGWSRHKKDYFQTKAMRSAFPSRIASWLLVSVIPFTYRQWNNLSSAGAPNSVFEQNMEQSAPGNRQQQKQDEEGFSACLLVMDDNHYLIEWLAYHYQSLPLTRLIIASDPRSRTSPTKILDRYRQRGLMDISEWYNDEFMPMDDILERDKRIYAGKNITKTLVHWHRHRQQYFNLACMRTLKAENRTWTLLLDTDEYLVRNRHADDHHQIRHGHNRTVYEMLNMERTRNISSMMRSPCVSFPRLRFGVQEGDDSEIQLHTPEGYNSSDFNSLRWRKRANSKAGKLNRLGKAAMDVSRVDLSMLAPSPREGNPHIPVKKLCEKNVYIESPNAPFIVHHYVGTYEQFSFREDVRDWARSQETYETYRDDNRYSEVVDDSTCSWLNDFVASQGDDLASDLLAGAGFVPPKAKT
jgi:hypothetical protein